MAYLFVVSCVASLDVLKAAVAVESREVDNEDEEKQEQEDEQKSTKDIALYLLTRGSTNVRFCKQLCIAWKPNLPG